MRNASTNIGSTNKIGKCRTAGSTRLLACAMTFTTYPDSEQTQLAADIRAVAAQHQTTPLYRWRTALEQVNPEVITVEPYCMGSALAAVYDLLDVATDA